MVAARHCGYAAAHDRAAAGRALGRLSALGRRRRMFLAVGLPVVALEEPALAAERLLAVLKCAAQEQSRVLNTITMQMRSPRLDGFNGHSNDYCVYAAH